MSRSNHLNDTSALAIQWYQTEMQRLIQRVFAGHYPKHLYLRQISVEEIDRHYPSLKEESGFQVWGAFDPEDDSLVVAGTDYDYLIEVIQKKGLIPLRPC